MYLEREPVRCCVIAAAVHAVFLCCLVMMEKMSFKLRDCVEDYSTGRELADELDVLIGCC
jgi:hypothetical protein